MTDHADLKGDELVAALTAAARRAMENDRQPTDCIILPKRGLTPPDEDDYEDSSDDWDRSRVPRTQEPE